MINKYLKIIEEGSSNFYFMSQIVNILVFAGCLVSLALIQLCCSVKAAKDTAKQMGITSVQQNFIYKKTVGQIWFMGFTERRLPWNWSIIRKVVRFELPCTHFSISTTYLRRFCYVPFLQISAGA